MPIPQPGQNETKDKFINRCMGDDKMNSEYPDNAQRFKICSAQWGGGENMSREISMEVMAPGTWNGIPFDKARLKKIVDNFKKLLHNHSVPLKIGHDSNDHQLKSKSKTQHALGWAADAWLNSADKIMVRFTDVPDIVHKAITKKLYRKVSVELDMGVNYKGEDVGDVLSGVALLGAEIPAVNTLEDLQAFLSADSGTIAGATKGCFATIETGYKPEEVNDMDLKELQDTVAKLSRTIKEQGDRQSVIEAENLKLVEENRKFAAEKAEFERKEKERANVEKAGKVKLARDSVTSVLESAVAQHVITPAQREDFRKMFSVDDDDAVTKIDIELFKRAIGGTKKFSVGDETANAHGGTMGDDDGDMSADERLDAEVQKVLASGETKDYARGMQLVLSRDRKLAAEYRDANGYAK